MTDNGRTVTPMSITDPTGIPEWTLGWRLQRSLAHGSVAVQAMADHLGVSRSTISRWLNEHGAPPKAAYLKQWALRCGVPYEWLRTGHGPTGPTTPGDQGVSPSAHIANRTAEVTHLPFRSAAAVAA